MRHRRRASVLIATPDAVSLKTDGDQLPSSVLHGLEVLSHVDDADEFHEGTRAFLERRRPRFR